MQERGVSVNCRISMRTRGSKADPVTGSHDFPTQASEKASTTSERSMPMGQDAGSRSSAEGGAQRMALQSTPVEQASPASLKGEVECSTLTIPALAAQCLREIDNFRRGEPCMTYRKSTACAARLGSDCSPMLINFVGGPPWSREFDEVMMNMMHE